MKRDCALCAVVVMLASFPASAEGVDSKPWSVRLGVGRVIFHERADVSLGGVDIPSAGLHTSNNTTAIFAIDYRFSPNFSVEFSGGVPPTTRLEGKGALAGLELGKVTYAPAVLSGKYHFTDFGDQIVPYVGVGLNYTIVTGAKDGFISNLKVRNAVAPVLQIGLNADITERFGVFLDAKWIALQTEATGSVGGAAANADVTLNPLLLGAGMVVRF